MSLVRWDPLSQLTTLENEMYRLWRRQLTEEGRAEEALTSTRFAPPVDIYEDQNRISLRMEVPGIDTKDLDVRVDGNMLTVSGERHLEQEEKKENFRRVERSYGAFTRSFTLPATADTNNVEASFRDGVLLIDIPKRAESRGKQIKIGERKGGSEQKPKAA